MPNDPLLSRALAVLAKAEATTFEQERSALVYGGYVLLARYLASHPVAPDAEGRRRERRLVADRRRRASRKSGSPRTPVDASVAYLTSVHGSGAGAGGRVDAAI